MEQTQARAAQMTLNLQTNFSAVVGSSRDPFTIHMCCEFEFRPGFFEKSRKPDGLDTGYGSKHHWAKT
jgi:hypothetical protein